MTRDDVTPLTDEYYDDSSSSHDEDIESLRENLRSAPTQFRKLTTKGRLVRKTSFCSDDTIITFPAKGPSDGDTLLEDTGRLSSLDKRSFHSFHSMTGASIKSEHLGEKIDQMKHSFPKKSQLWTILITLIVSFIIFYSCVYGVVMYFMEPFETVDTEAEISAATAAAVGGESGSSTNATSPAVAENQQSEQQFHWIVTGTFPAAQLSDEEFDFYLGMFLWITMLLAGIGMELMVWINFLSQGWDRSIEIKWRFAEFMFPLFGAMTMGLASQRNFLAMITFVIGFYKCGFPETLAYMHTAIYENNNDGGGGNYTSNRKGRGPPSLYEIFRRFPCVASNYLNSVGLLIHHSAGGLCVAMWLTGKIPVDRHTVMAHIILVAQHWFILVKYVNVPLYMIIELTLEGLFEWAALSELERYKANYHWTAVLAVGTMILAHWMFLVAAAFELFSGNGSNANGIDEDDDSYSDDIEKD